MAYNDLQDFIAALEAAGQLIRIKEPVSAEREITEIADRVMKSPDGGTASAYDGLGF